MSGQLVGDLAGANTPRINIQQSWVFYRLVEQNTVNVLRSWSHEE